MLRRISLCSDLLDIYGKVYVGGCTRLIKMMNLDGELWVYTARVLVLALDSMMAAMMWTAPTLCTHILLFISILES